jgi:predicted 3-demethylubiquinone-9 3-methyltransferase (glyoxalase superfamily)
LEGQTSSQIGAAWYRIPQWRLAHLKIPGASAMPQKILPHLWFDKEAKEAAEFYTSILPGSRITNVTTLRDTPSGDCDVVSFELARFRFMAISAGPLFTFNPSISFFLNFDPSRDSQARENLNTLWEQLSAGGTPLMPLDTYPFSEHYGWVQDRYGLSWQLILSNPAGEPRPFIVPSLMFTGSVAGRAEEAIDLYTSVFRDAKRGLTARYGAGMEPDREGTIMFADFMLENQWFAAMDSAHAHKFGFTEAISLLVRCETQSEIDDYWGKLSAVPEAEQCGWLKDRFGISWQIAPAELDRMMSEGTPEQIARVTQAFLPMKKFDLAELQRAYAET